MKCKKCGKDMQLRRYMDHDTYNPKSERFIYECSDCGVLDNPKKNIDYTKIYQKKREEILKDLLEFGLIVDKKVLNFLVKHHNPFPIISLLTRRDNKVITKLNLEEFEE
jgi:hypothetical protein